MFCTQNRGGEVPPLNTRGFAFQGQVIHVRIHFHSNALGGVPEVIQWKIRVHYWTSTPNPQCITFTFYGAFFILFYYPYISYFIICTFLFYYLYIFFMLLSVHFFILLSVHVLLLLSVPYFFRTLTKSVCGRRLFFSAQFRKKNRHKIVLEFFNQVCVWPQELFFRAISSKNRETKILKLFCCFVLHSKHGRSGV